MARRLAGAAPALPSEGDWPAVGSVSAEAWRAARDRLREAHDNLADAVRGHPPEPWGDRVGAERGAPLGTGVTYTTMIRGLVQHDAYHDGQLGLRRRAPGV